MHFRTCNLCEAMCGLKVEVEGGKVVKISGDEKDEFSRGYHCIKAEALQDLHEDPERLKRPVKRVGEEFVEISWDEALDLAHRGLAETQEKFGRDSVASYLGNPNVHNYGSILFVPELVRALGSKNRFSATSVDQLPHHFVGYFLFGHQLLLPVPDIDRTHYMLIFGGNPVVSRGSMMSAPDVTERLKAIRARGGKIRLFDPRKTETAAVVDAHHFITPGTDALLALGLLQVIFEDKREAPGRLASVFDGIDELRSLARRFSLENIAARTGIARTEIETIAREFVASPTAVAYGRIGASTQEFGALTQWLITALNAVTGNLDRAGGAMFTTPAFNTLPLASPGHYARFHSRVRRLPEFGGELPVSAMAEDMLAPGPGQIRGLLTIAGNPALSTPNGTQVERALKSLHFMVSIDPYINESTRHANVILPPTVGLEHENYDIAFHLLAVRNTAKYSPTLFERTADQRHDWEIFRELIARFGSRNAKKGKLRRWLGQRLHPETLLALGLRFGPHGAGVNPFGGGLTLPKLKRAPHGIDLGPLQPCLPGRLRTKNRRIDLAPKVFLDDAVRLAGRSHLPAPTNSLTLIGRRQVRTNNSWMGHVPRLTKGRSTCTALLNPEDAATRGIATGDTVRVSSRVGTIEILAVIAHGIMPGVVSIPHGFGHGRLAGKRTFLSGAEGPSLNDLTDDQFIDVLSGNAALSGLQVTVERV